MVTIYIKREIIISTCSNIIVRRASAASLTRMDAGFSSFSSFILIGSPGLPILFVPDTPNSTTSNTVVKQSLSYKITYYYYHLECYIF